MVKQAAHYIKQLYTQYWTAENRDMILQKCRALLKSSESPAGFMGIAAFGLVLVLLFNIGGESSVQETGEHSAPDFQAESMDTVEQAVTTNEPKVPEPQEENLVLRRGETLINLLRRAGIDYKSAYAAVTELGQITNLRKLQAGESVYLTRTSAGHSIDRLGLRDTFDSQALVEIRDGAYAAKREAIPTLPLTHLVSGTITDSLYLSGKRAGLPDKVIVELIRLLSFDVDFERDIREGDTFQVYFERSYAPGYDDLEEGRILQAILNLRGRQLEATLYVDAKGNTDYFDSNGESTRRTLMKTPLDVTVVTSSYGQRKHPVLGYTRMHKGVDFRARTGTPIMAAGDGVVERASRYGSYGNYIRIRHNSTYKTAYAHLSRYGRGIKAGARVKQGQVIGYAGATGRVSAAHLHYEVLVNGKQANPLTLKLPTGRTLKGDTLNSFRDSRNYIMADIQQIRAREDILMADEENSRNTKIADNRVNSGASPSPQDPVR